MVAGQLYLKVNTTLHHYKINWLMLFGELIDAYSEKYTETIKAKGRVNEC
jgi:hypothetical protein